MSELAIIIVSWNTRDLTLDALRTLYTDLAANGPDSEVWVVDNASLDGSAEAITCQFPQVKLINSPTNLGFAGGNNAALRQITSTKAVYLLNSDTRTHPGATHALFDALFRLPKAGVVGARLFYEDGGFQHSAFHFPGLWQLVIDLFPTPGRFYDSALNGRYPRQAYEGKHPFPVDHTLGATMMLRREVIEQTGLFDEQYFMYCEEIDWSIRIRRAGWNIYCIPTAEVTHLAGQSTKQVRPQSIVNLWRSRFRLFDQYYSFPQRLIVRAIVRLGMQRQIRLARQNGQMSPEQQAALIEAYETVAKL